MSALPSTLHKEERIYSKKIIDALFKGDRSHSLSAFPLRVVYMPLETEKLQGETDAQQPVMGGKPQGMGADFSQQSVQQTTPNDGNEVSGKPQAKFLISVPKRYFKHAVKRNRVKRQVREAYRKHKALVADYPVALAFIWLDDELRNSNEVESRVINLLRRISERLQKETRL